MTLFASQSLAHRIEQAQSQNQKAWAISHGALFPASSFQAITIGGGVALYAGDGSPFTQAFGLGFNGTPSDQELDTLEQFFFDRATSVNIEVANLADVGLTQSLGKRGYTVSEYSHVLGYDVSQASVPALRATSTAVVEESKEHVEVIAQAVASGFFNSNVGEQDIPREFIDIFVVSGHIPNSHICAEYADGAIAGGGMMFVEQGLAMLAGTSVQPRYRGRGIQQRLIAHRLALAVEAGCDYAIVATEPGSISQQNMQKWGFQILYARTKFTKAYRG